MTQSTDERNKSHHKFISCPWNHSWLQVSPSPLSFQSSHTKRVRGNEIRPHCAGSRETIRELWLTEVPLENGSFVHLSFNHNYLHNYPVCLWHEQDTSELCLHLTFSPENPNMLRNTWLKRNYSWVLWIGDYKMQDEKCHSPNRGCEFKSLSCYEILIASSNIHFLYMEACKFMLIILSWNQHALYSLRHRNDWTNRLWRLWWMVPLAKLSLLLYIYSRAAGYFVVWKNMMLSCNTVKKLKS